MLHVTFDVSHGSGTNLQNEWEAIQLMVMTLQNQGNPILSCPAEACRWYLQLLTLRRAPSHHWHFHWNSERMGLTFKMGKISVLNYRGLLNLNSLNNKLMVSLDNMIRFQCLPLAKGRHQWCNSTTVLSAPAQAQVDWGKGYLKTKTRMWHEAHVPLDNCGPCPPKCFWNLDYLQRASEDTGKQHQQCLCKILQLHWKNKWNNNGVLSQANNTSYTSLGWVHGAGHNDRMPNSGLQNRY